MLPVLKSGAAHAQQILAALKRHFLGKLHSVGVAGLHRLDIRSLEHGVGARQLRAHLVLDGEGENGGLNLRVKADTLPDGEHFPF